MQVLRFCTRPRSRSRRGLGQVLEQLWVLLVPLQVLSRDEVLNALFDQLEVGLEHARQLLHHLHHQLLVLQHLAALHGAHNGGVNGVLAVLVHVLNHPLLLVHRGQGHLDAPHAVRELVVEAELVVLGDVLGRGVLGQDLVLGTRQAVQQAAHVVVLQVEPLLHLLVAELLSVVEQHEAGCLQGGEGQLNGLLVKVALHDAHAQGVDPAQLAVLVLALVKLLEHLHALHHLLGQCQLSALICGPEASGEHRHVNLNAQLLRLRLQPLLKLLLLLTRQLQISHHALHLGRELRAALLLEP
mmetsp:Transcript_37707/g.83986  ORF Transcript_37707/g.83986 Transcript_37707/m.83986 type:complete len:299 (-) Transcript_37707:1703-2599(-)